MGSFTGPGFCATVAAVGAPLFTVLDVLKLDLKEQIGRAHV